MTLNELTRLHATVSGHVQGVYFRAYVQDQAEMLDLRGWVRNRWSGTVEVTAEGSKANLEALLVALRQGPPQATVDDVCYEWLTATGEFIRFELAGTE